MEVSKAPITFDAPKALFSARTLVLLSPLAVDLFLPTLPQLITQHGENASLLVSSYLLSLGMGQLIFGPLSDRYGRRPIALFGAALFGFCSLLLPFVPNLWALVFLRFLQGFGGSATSVCSMSLVRDCFQGEKAAREFSILMGTLNTVPSLAPFLGGLLGTWEKCFLALAGVAACTWIFVWFQMPETRVPHQRKKTKGVHHPHLLQGYGEILRHKGFWLHAVSCLASLSLVLCYISVAPGDMITKAGMSPMAFSLCFGGNALVMTLAGFAASPLILRLGSLKVLALGLGCLFVGAIGFLATSEMTDPWSFFIPIAVVSVGFSFVLGPASALAMEPFGHRVGTVSAMIGSLQMMCAAVVSAYFPMVFTNHRWGLGILGVFFAVLCGVCVFFGKKYRKLPPSLANAE